MAISLFGTDGIRSKVNNFPMTTETVMQVGKALAKVLGATGHGSIKVVIGKDTRLSGYMFESALEAGLVSMGADVFLTGPLPTPTLAWLTKTTQADAGIMITASHNPVGDNGLKIFNGNGFKLTDQQEKEIEALVLQGTISTQHIEPLSIGKTTRWEHKVSEYIDYAKSLLNVSLQGLKVVLDTANGASYQLAVKLLQELGVEIVYHRGNKPNGQNINKNVGVYSLSSLRSYAQQHEADLSICLDGDGDRVLFLDEQGNIIDGDHILALLAVFFKKQGKLHQDSIVVTEMSNHGMLAYLRKQQIHVFLAPVGDRHVLQVMQREACNLGGEQSGHIIFLDHVTTGDGLITALQLMSIMVAENKQLSELTADISLYPQILKNYKFKEAIPINELIVGWEQVRADLLKKYLNNKGRIFVRPSGTEKLLLRVLVEGEHILDVEECLEEISRMFRFTGLLAD